MEERTEILICLGAASAAGCVPCFEHYYGKAQAINLSPEEIVAAVGLAGRVKQGAQMAMRNSIRDIMGQEGQDERTQCGKSGRSCCA